MAFPPVVGVGGITKSWTRTRCGDFAGRHGRQIQRFILFIGPISSIFDYLTFFIMLYVFNAWTNPRLFQTGWFVESVLTQTLIIHVIRTNKIPFIESRASWPLIATSLIIVVVGCWLTVSPLASTLGFV